MQVSGFRIYFLEPGYFFSKILSEFRKKIVALHETMEKQGVKTDDLLRKFEKLGFNPIPLRVGYAAKKMPSLLHILRAVEEEPVTIELEYWKWK